MRSKNLRARNLAIHLELGYRAMGTPRGGCSGHDITPATTTRGTTPGMEGDVALSCKKMAAIEKETLPIGEESHCPDKSPLFATPHTSLTNIVGTTFIHTTQRKSGVSQQLTVHLPKI